PALGGLLRLLHAMTFDEGNVSPGFLGRALDIAAGASLFSPALPFFQAFGPAFAASTRGFWWSLFVSHGLGWFFLVLASWLLPRRWQEKPASVSKPKLVWSEGDDR